MANRWFREVWLITRNKFKLHARIQEKRHTEEIQNTGEEDKGKRSYMFCANQMNDARSSKNLPPLQYSSGGLSEYLENLKPLDNSQHINKY